MSENKQNKHWLSMYIQLNVIFNVIVIYIYGCCSGVGLVLSGEMNLCLLLYVREAMLLAENPNYLWQVVNFRIQ